MMPQMEGPLPLKETLARELRSNGGDSYTNLGRRSVAQSAVAVIVELPPPFAGLDLRAFFRRSALRFA